MTTTTTHPRLYGPGEGAPEHGHWIVTKDFMFEDGDDEAFNRVGTEGPGSHAASEGVPTDVDAMLADERFVRWQTRDDDGERIHEGIWIEGEYDAEGGTNPLNALSAPDAGAVSLWLRIAAEWKCYLG